MLVICSPISESSPHLIWWWRKMSLYAISTRFYTAHSRIYKIDSIHPKTYALTVLMSPGTSSQLPPSILASFPPLLAMEDLPPLRQAIVTSPTQLESAILDVDGRIERARRSSANAWKCLSLWRTQGAFANREGEPEQRGGRVNCGTLFYLRGCFYQEW